MSLDLYKGDIMCFLCVYLNTRWHISETGKGIYFMHSFREQG